MVNKASETKAHPGGDLPNSHGFAALDWDHAVVETVKKSEDDDASIVRIYEYKQYRTDEVKLTFGRPIRKAVECNLVEEEENTADFAGNHIIFSLKPYEIKTYKIWF
jgi:alpha-mannosidase